MCKWDPTGSERQEKCNKKENQTQQKKKMGMRTDQANETMLVRGHWHLILNPERNISDSEFYTQEKDILKTR